MCKVSWLSSDACICNLPLVIDLCQTISEGKFLAVLFRWFFLDDPFGYQESLRKRENFEISDISISNTSCKPARDNYFYNGFIKFFLQFKLI